MNNGKQTKLAELEEIKRQWASYNLDLPENFFIYEVWERRLWRAYRYKKLKFVRPFIYAGLIRWEALEGLTFNEVRTVIWQMRKSLPEEHILRQRVIPQTTIPRPVSGENNLSYTITLYSIYKSREDLEILEEMLATRESLL